MLFFWRDLRPLRSKIKDARQMKGKSNVIVNRIKVFKIEKYSLKIYLL